MPGSEKPMFEALEDRRLMSTSLIDSQLLDSSLQTTTTTTTYTVQSSITKTIGEMRGIGSGSKTGL